ncbi:TPA: hypothetical protein DDZ86_03150 [Candidatus Dependentiae bacterium]|nr:MAG: Tyrosine recombinase XerC [candidate division TM6 bacterium GW2011_GWF2_43_87]HBL98613.1 hypothetical protein [Candidatus Dependentiae bacterium]
MEREAIQAHVDDFLLFLKAEKHVAENTCRSYASDLRNFFDFWQAYELKKEKVTAFKEVTRHYRASVAAQKSRASTLARKLSCLNSFNRFLANRGLVTRFTLVRPHVTLKAPEILSIKEIAYLLDEVPLEKIPSATPYRDRSILELLYATGMRCSELSALTLAHITMTEKSITIPGKRRRTRTVFFGEKARVQLSNYLKCERPTPANDREILFLNQRGEPLTTRSIQRTCNMFSAFLQSKKTVTPQILRHSFAVHLLEKGTCIETVQELMGLNTRISTERYIR